MTPPALPDTDTDLDTDAVYVAPYRNDPCLDISVIELPAKTMAVLEAHVQTPHQEELMALLRTVSSCPEPLPLLLHPRCTPSESERVRSDRIYAVLQLLTQVREQEHQSLLRRTYKTFGSDHRAAARALYARELFPAAYSHYHALYACLACDRCRNLPPPVRTATAADLLEKLAVTCLRAGWPADAAAHAIAALRRDPASPRARVWLATAHLALGDLPAARRSLDLASSHPHPPPPAPPWILARVRAQRAVLARLEREAAGAYDRTALAHDPPDAPPPGPHFTTLARAVHRTPAFRTAAPVPRGALLLVAHPVACVPCFTPPDAILDTLHTEDPALLVLARLADALYAQAQALTAVRAPLLAAVPPGGVPPGRNRLRAAAVYAAQACSVPVPGTGGRTRHGGHAVYMPLVEMHTAAGFAATAGNTLAVFCGPHLFLHAARDLDEGTLLIFDGFDRSSRVSTPVSSPLTADDTTKTATEIVKALDLDLDLDLALAPALIATL